MLVFGIGIVNFNLQLELRGKKSCKSEYKIKVKILYACFNKYIKYAFSIYIMRMKNTVVLNTVENSHELNIF